LERTSLAIRSFAIRSFPLQSTHLKGQGQKE
jgi:hypothetical protein